MEGGCLALPSQATIKARDSEILPDIKEALKEWAVLVTINADDRTYQYKSDSSREGCDAQYLLMKDIPV